MISPDLPAALKAALEAKLHGLSRQDAAARATRISDTYRGGGNSGAITTDADAIAYATVRMPATYAAVAASLNALMQASPDFAPGTVLDVGAGPGTASFAAAEAFSSLTSFNAIDANPALRTLALSLAEDGLRSRDLTYALGAARGLLDRAERADLAIASYMINELSDIERMSVVDLLWEKTNQTLLIVEPGTPAGYQRIIAARDQLIAIGAHVAAPCPHAAACPLITPDWCHFVQRLARSRAHRELKGADVPFEDEKFSFVAVTRQPVMHRPPARVLAPPMVTKIAATAKLCLADGSAASVSIPRRDKVAFAAARRWDWGDGVDLPPRP
ncbi:MULTISPECIES: small ribosomal subunit Rsm22 family protein [unclassified Bradyrhizobium]|uniref:small ribosomal subunit Rsm22 family protein n=1 Tax=unclassified Bradyrhizobium TaxID=2631580 RepID=UPI0028E63A86|nr:MULTISPECIES: small ribosomal subunit Rsm22 family protein [unclassified Bradyrhizobium]